MTTPAQTSYSTSTNWQVVQITAVNPTAQTATGYTRQQDTLTIDTRYGVGAVQVTPCVGEQWYVNRGGNSWILTRRVPKNTTTPLNVADYPVEGLTQIGSSGPTEGPLLLMGSAVVAQAPLQLESSTTTDLPTPASVAPGTVLYNSTTHEIVFSDGTAWNPLQATTTEIIFTPVIGEIPIGAIDGTNPTFITAQHFAPGSTALYRNGLREIVGLGYTETAPNILTLSIPPQVGDLITTDYVVGT
jgi:hypothetical protein